MQDLVKLIKKDPNYLKFVRLVESVRQRVDIEGNTKEALGLHTSRTSRALHGQDRYSPTALIDASLKDLSYRARLVEIRVRHDIQMALLAEAIESVRRHIITEYVEDLKGFSTIEQRKAFVDRVLKTPNTFRTEGQSLLATLDVLIKDIDQSSYALKNVMECLKLVASSSGKVV